MSSVFSFGSVAERQPQSQTQGTSLFGGGTTAQSAPTNPPLFGSSTTTQVSQPNQQPAGTALFGSGATSSSSLFNQPSQTSQAQPSASLLQPAATTTNPPQAHLSSLLQAGLTKSTHTPFGALGTTSQADLARSRLQAANIHSAPNEKSVPQQIQTLIRKWDPNSQDTLLQAYLYNAVNSAYAPFYYRNPDESEKEWEEALARKPENVQNKDGDSVSFVPVLVRGFRALGQRIEYQAKTVNEMRHRLHEMNNSLQEVMNTHQQNITVRLENAKRQHAALSARCLRLAVKAQVLRGRSYPLSQEEENLRKTLLALEKTVFDPSLSAREEEIWARMVSLRERARWLEEEMKRLGASGEEIGKAAAGGAGGVTEEVLQMTKKILRDYEGQLSHLARELEAVRKEFDEFVDHGAGKK